MLVSIKPLNIKLTQKRENSYQNMKRSLDEKHTQKHRSYLIYFDNLNQKRITVCEHMVKMASHEFLKSAIREVRGCKTGRGEGRRETLNGNYLRLIPGLCLENRRN